MQFFSALGTFQMLSSHHGKWQPYWTAQTENITIRAEGLNDSAVLGGLLSGNERMPRSSCWYPLSFRACKAVPWCLLWREERTETVRKGGVIAK